MENKVRMSVKTKGRRGNSLELLKKFQMKAVKQGMPIEKIDELMVKCKSGDYANLLRVIKENTYKPVKFNDAARLMVKFAYKAAQQDHNLEIIENIIMENCKSDYSNLLNGLEDEINEFLVLNEEELVK
jgi:hypothetical protein